VGYYTGDPGFFSIVKSVGGAFAGLIPGVGGGLSRAISKIPLPVKRTAGTILRSAGGAIIKHPVLSAAGAAGALALGAGELGRMSMARGKHPSMRHMRALAMGLRRARPRMNVTNVHALRRSLRRVHGFARLAMKVIHIVHPKKKGKFGGFRGKRKSHK